MTEKTISHDQSISQTEQINKFINTTNQNLPYIMKEESVKKAYEIAKERYAAVGIDTDKVLDQMQDFHLSICLLYTSDAADD